MENRTETKILTEAEETFCVKYTETGKGWLAAQMAGYAPDNRKSAERQARRLLKKKEITEKIKSLRSELLSKTEYSRKTIYAAAVRRLMAIINTDITDIINISSPESPTRQQELDTLTELSGGQTLLDFGETLIVPTSALTAEQQAAIKTFKITRDRGIPNIDLQMHDPIAAIKLLTELAGLKEIDGGANVVVTISDAVREIEGRKNDRDAERNIFEKQNN